MKKKTFNFVKIPLRYLLLYLLILTFLGVFPLLTVNNSDITDFAWSILKGYSNDGFNTIEFLYFWSWFVFPLIRVLSFWEDEKQQKNETALVRVGSYRMWRKMSGDMCAKFFVEYWLCYFLVTVFSLSCLCLAFGYNSENAAYMYAYFNISAENYMSALIASVFLRLVELVFLYEFALAIFGAIRNTVVAFLIPFVASMICALWLPSINPFGFSSAYRIINVLSGGKETATVLCPLVLFVILITFNSIRRKYK